MRTQEEITERYKSMKDRFMDFQPEVLFQYMDFAKAQPFLKEDVTEEEWNKTSGTYTRDNVIEEARIYMRDYGWPKAQGHRGISTSRTVDKMTALVWLAGDDDFLEIIKETSYENYGAPILGAICVNYNWPIPDDPELHRMMRSEKCRSDCPSCGS